MASTHIENVDSIDDATVAAICDINEVRAESVAESYDANAYTDHTTMYDEEGLDAVYISIPPFAHTDQEIEAARRGIAMYVEKPLGLDLESVRERADAIERNDVIAMTGYQRRYNDVIRELKDLVDGHTLTLIEFHRYLGIPGAPWFGEKEMSGGQIVEQATHEYDLARYLGGEVSEVFGYGSQRVATAELDYEDTNVGLLKHENGMLSKLSGSMVSPDHDYALNVVGEDLRLAVEMDPWRLSGVVDDEEVSVELETDPRLKADESFVRAVQNDDHGEVRSPYDDGVKSCALTLAMNDAIGTGEPVQLQNFERVTIDG